MSENSSPCSALPSRHLAKLQTQWLRGARSRLLRRAGIVKRKRVLEIGAGWGFVANELQHRSSGEVISLDLNFPIAIDGVEQVVGDARRLPFSDASFDLIFSQLVLLWVQQPELAIVEAHRVLEPGGAFVAIEPDYGGMMETPGEASTKEVWIAALTRAGADPCIGRKLPNWLTSAGFQVETRFLDRLEDADDARFDILAQLPLTPDELALVKHRKRTKTPAIVHLPFWLIVAEKPSIEAERTARPSST